MKRFWVYMLLCSDGSYYIGVTNNVERRIAEHNAGEDEGCYTYTRRPVSLIYAADFRNPTEAIDWEKHIKRWSRAKKAALARGDFESLKRLARGHGSTGSP